MKHCSSGKNVRGKCLVVYRGLKADHVLVEFKYLRNRSILISFIAVISFQEDPNRFPDL